MSPPVTGDIIGPPRGVIMGHYVPFAMAFGAETTVAVTGGAIAFF